MKSDRNIEQAITDSTVETNPAADKRHLAEMLEAQRTARLNRISSGWALLAPARIAAAVIFLTAGFIVARATSPDRIDPAQLENALRTSLQNDIADVVADKIAAMPAPSPTLDTDKVASAVWLQLQQEMPELMAAVFEASEARTDERFKEMAAAIDRARTRDMRQIAATIEQIEAERLEDRYRIGQGLVRLAARSDTTADFKRK